MTFTHALATNNYGPAKWIVDASAANGTHTTIAAALTSSSSGDTIFIRPGTYTENLTLKAGVNLTAYGSDSSQNGTGKVIISGTCTLTTAGSVTISGIQLQTNSAALLAITGSAASIVNLENCYLNCTNNTGITYSSSSGSSALNIRNCSGNLGTTGIALFAHSSSGAMSIFDSNFTNTGASTTANTISSGSLFLISGVISNPITTSSTGLLSAFAWVFQCGPINSIALTHGGDVLSNATFCSFGGGTNSCITISTTFGLFSCSFNSGNTNAVTGAGTVNYQAPTFSSASQTINTTTQTNSGTVIGSKNTAPSAGFLGEQISSAVSGVLFTSTVVKNLTSITLTAGVWDVTMGLGINYTGGTGIGTYIGSSISTVSATFQGNGGDQRTDFSAITGTFSVLNSWVIAFRVVVTTSTTYFGVAVTNFTATTATGSGRLSAVRVG